ncbi:MAG: gliding motility-associated-like protein, partial [Saprospiraceae bacterium]
SAVLSTVWTFDDGSSVTTTTVDTVAQTYNTGTYGVKVSQTFANGCIAESTYLNMVTVDALPVAGFTYLPAQPTVLDPRVQFADSSEIAVSFKWDFGRTATPSGSSSPIPFVEFDTENGDTIKVCMVAYSQALQTGCTDTVCKDVIILNNLSVYVPNSFTPNGDGLNDVFYPLGKYHDNQEGLSEYEFLIFNRWGEVVFKSTVPYKGWNGAYMNHDVQEEVYVWMIKVYDPLSGKTKTSNGTVTVVR